MSADLARAIKTASQSLKHVLRPRFSQVGIDDRTVTFTNLVGSFRLDTGEIVKVRPKTDHGQDWAGSVARLLTPNTRVGITGSSHSRRRESGADSALAVAIRIEYGRRLERALRSDGPVQAYERVSETTHRLRGRLQVTDWLRTAALKPTDFPVVRDELTIHNDFARAMALVAEAFARSTASPQLASKLHRLASNMTVGESIPARVNPAVTSRDLPPQWAKFDTAWDIARSFLNNRSLMGGPGRWHGFEVSVEPWPLLEELLQRALQTIVRQGLVPGVVNVPPKNRYGLLRGTSGLTVEPDGVVMGDGRTLASFEAKYTTKVRERDHVFQAVTTAAVLQSPLAVLVYPGDEGVHVEDVAGHNGNPGHLATLGLGMYRYGGLASDIENAKKIADAMVTNRLVIDPGA
ncbi:MAG: McrC family protein [Propionibacteriaceae bacterium]|jgi:hypothetical protein|nr:McrC family protein [Propionibacteriaceae bacterium]